MGDNNNWQGQLNNVSWANRSNSGSGIRSNTVNTVSSSNNSGRSFATARSMNRAVGTVVAPGVPAAGGAGVGAAANNNAASTNSVRRQANLGNAARQRTNPVTVRIDKTEQRIDDFPETEMILQVLVDRGLIKEADKKEYDATVTINGVTIPINYINTFYDLHELDHYQKEAFGSLQIVVTLIKKRKKWFGLFGGGAKGGGAKGGGANGKRKTRKVRRNRRRKARKTSKY